MASQGKIDEIVGQEAFRQVELLTDKLNSANQALLNNINSAQQLNNAIGGAKSFKDLSGAIENQSKAIDRMANSSSKARLEEIRLQQAREKAFDDYEKKLAKQEAAQKKAAAAAAEAARPYNVLTKQLREAEKAAADIGVAFGTTSPQFQEATKNVQGLRTQVDAIEQPLGKFQRNVGNYASAAYGYLRTAANILPGLGISGILLLGIEGITALISAFEELDKQTKTSVQTARQLATAIGGTEYTKAVSDVNELRINVGLAKQGFIDKNDVVKQYNETIGKTTGQVRTLNEVEQGLVKNADSFIKFTLYKAAAQTALQEASKEAVKVAKEQQRDVSRALNGTGEDIVQAYEGVPFLTRLADAFNADDTGLREFNQKTIASGNKTKDQLLDIANKFQEQAALIAKNNKFNFFGDNGADDKQQQKDATAAINRLIEAERTRNQTVQADESSSYDERLKSSAQFVAKETELINRRREIELGAESLTADGRKAIRQSAANDIKKVELDGLKDRQKVDADATKELEQQYQVQMRLASDADKATVASLEAATQERLRLNSKTKDDALLQLSDQYKRGFISEREYRDDVLIVEEESAKESLQIQLDQLNTLIEARKAAGIETADLEAKSAAIQAKINDDLTKKKIKNDEEYAKLQERQRKELVQKTREIADALIDLAKTIVDASYQNQQDDIKNQSDAIDKKAEQDKKDVDRSLLTSEQKADAEALIDAQAQAQKEQLAARSKQLANEQAKADRLFTIAKIIETTALAAVAALAPPPVGLGPVLGIPLAVAVGALGAVQLATVLATPLPQYAKGTRNAKGGASIVGELGTELVIDPQGRTSLTPNGPTLTYLQPGSQVLTHKETMALMMRPEKLNTAQSGGMSWEAFAKLQEKNTARLERSMGVKVNTQRITKAGFRGGVAAMSAWNDRKRNYLR